MESDFVVIPAMFMSIHEWKLKPERSANPKQKYLQVKVDFLTAK